MRGGNSPFLPEATLYQWQKREADPILSLETTYSSVVFGIMDKLLWLVSKACSLFLSKRFS